LVSTFCGSRSIGRLSFRRRRIERTTTIAADRTGDRARSADCGVTRIGSRIERVSTRGAHPATALRSGTHVLWTNRITSTIPMNAANI
jgi:hypothetical protein